MESVLAKSTTNTYTTGNRQYIKFCSLHSISDPYPAQEDYILGFIAYLYMHHKAASTIHVYLYAIRYHQLYTYSSDPLKGKHKLDRSNGTGHKAHQESQQTTAYPHYYPTSHQD